MKLIREELTNTDFLVEDDKNGKKNYFIEGIFMQSNIKNRNGRRYPLDVMEKEVRRYDKENIKKNQFFNFKARKKKKIFILTKQKITQKKL